MLQICQPLLPSGENEPFLLLKIEKLTIKRYCKVG